MSSESLLSAHEDEEELFPGLRRAMEARAEHQKTKNYRFLYSVTTCLGGLGVALLLTWCISYKEGFAWHSDLGKMFNWHPFLMVTGMVFTYAQSMLIYRTARFAPKKKLKITHTTLHCLAFILAVIGLIAVFDAHNYAIPPRPNLYSLHSWVGLTTVIIFALQFFFGFITFLFPGLPRTWKQLILPMHTAIGSAAFIMALVSTMMGITEVVMKLDKYAELQSEGVLLNFIGIILVCFGILSLYLVNETDYKRSPLATDEMALTENE